MTGNRTGLAGLTLRELYEVERVAKVKVGALGDAKSLGAREMAAIGWVIRKRDDPGYTFEQALELTMGEVNELIAGGAEADPTLPATSSESES